jgi:hypothetical protein
LLEIRGGAIAAFLAVPPCAGFGANSAGPELFSRWFLPEQTKKQLVLLVYAGYSAGRQAGRF